jgi:hypothetical protein
MRLTVICLDCRTQYQAGVVSYRRAGLLAFSVINAFGVGAWVWRGTDGGTLVAAICCVLGAVFVGLGFLFGASIPYSCPSCGSLHGIPTRTPRGRELTGDDMPDPSEMSHGNVGDEDAEFQAHKTPKR